jgi:hypothetical protein
MHACACMPRPLTQTGIRTRPLPHSYWVKRTTQPAWGDTLPYQHRHCAEHLHRPPTTRVVWSGITHCLSTCSRAPSRAARHLSPQAINQHAQALMHVQALLEGRRAICNGQNCLLSAGSLAGHAPHQHLWPRSHPRYFACVLRHKPAFGTPIVDCGTASPLHQALLQNCSRHSLCHGQDFQQCSRYSTEPHRSLPSLHGVKCSLRAVYKVRQSPLSYCAPSNAGNHTAIPEHPSERKMEEKKRLRPLSILAARHPLP